MTFNLTAITGILTSVTIFAFVESVLFAIGMTFGLRLDVMVYMQPWDYVVITPYWLGIVLLSFPILIAMAYYPDFLFNYGNKEFYFRRERSLIQLFKQFYRTKALWPKILLLLQRWRGPIIWIVMLVFMGLVIRKASHNLARAPLPPVREWNFVAAFLPPLLSFRFFTWLLPQLPLRLPLLYKTLILPLIASLWLTAFLDGQFWFSMLALDSTALTRISLKAETGDHYNRIVRGTILLRLTDRLLVLSPNGDSKTLQPRSLTGIPLTEVRLIEATQ